MCLQKCLITPQYIQYANLPRLFTDLTPLTLFYAFLGSNILTSFVVIVRHETKNPKPKLVVDPTNAFTYKTVLFCGPAPPFCKLFAV